MVGGAVLGGDLDGRRPAVCASRRAAASAGSVVPSTAAPAPAKSAPRRGDGHERVQREALAAAQRPPGPSRRSSARRAGPARSRPPRRRSPGRARTAGRRRRRRPSPRGPAGRRRRPAGSQGVGQRRAQAAAAHDRAARGGVECRCGGPVPLGDTGRSMEKRVKNVAAVAGVTARATIAVAAPLASPRGMTESAARPSSASTWRRQGCVRCPAAPVAAQRGLRLGRRGRGPDVRRRGARRQRGPSRAAVRRPGREAAGEAAGRDRDGAGGRLHRERPEVPASRQPRPAAGRDRGLPRLPEPPGRADRAEGHLHAGELLDQAPARRPDGDHAPARAGGGPDRRGAGRPALPALPPRGRALHAVDAGDAARGLRPDPRPARAARAGPADLRGGDQDPRGAQRAVPRAEPVPPAQEAEPSPSAR